MSLKQNIYFEKIVYEKVMLTHMINTSESLSINSIPIQTNKMSTTDKKQSVIYVQ